MNSTMQRDWIARRDQARRDAQRGIRRYWSNTLRRYVVIPEDER